MGYGPPPLPRNGITVFCTGKPHARRYASGMRLLSRFLLFCITSTACFGQDADYTHSMIRNLDVGIICAQDPVGANPAPDTLTGSTHVIAGEPDFITDIRTVPAVLGIGFGVKSSVTDPAGLSDVVMRVSHPPMGAEGRTRQSFQTSISGEGTSLTFYQFDHEFELVTGTWQMTAMHGETVLYEVSFEVVPPKFLPELAGLCRYGDLLS